MRLWFGRYRGHELNDVPDDYLYWMLNFMERESLREIARNELKRRSAARARQHKPKPTDFDAITREMIEAGYRVLAKKFHPDLGGDTEKMQQLNEAMERFRR